MSASRVAEHDDVDAYRDVACRDVAMRANVMPMLPQGARSDSWVHENHEVEREVVLVPAPVKISRFLVDCVHRRC